MIEFDMKTLIIVILIVHWVFGFIWWRKYVYKQVKGYNNDIWEALSLWSAFFGGIFIFLYEYIKENNIVNEMRKHIDNFKNFLKEGKSYLDGSSERGFSLMEINQLNIGDKITFYFNSYLMDGVIIDKEELQNGDTLFSIETEKGVLKKSHRNLEVYKIY
jgi:hypothetical protein